MVASNNPKSFFKGLGKNMLVVVITIVITYVVTSFIQGPALSRTLIKENTIINADQDNRIESNTTRINKLEADVDWLRKNVVTKDDLRSAKGDIIDLIRMHMTADKQ